MQKCYSSGAAGRYSRVANQTDPSPWTVAQKMNLRASPPRPGDARPAGFRLALSLLPGVVLLAPSVATEILGPASRPYLTAVHAPALRFGEAPPPPPLWIRPAASAPPSPATGEPAAAPLEPTGEIPPQHVPASSVQAPPPDVIPPATTQAPAKTPAPILPDDTRPKVRAEDFLPFFHFPGSATNTGDVTIVTPAVPGQPASSTPQPRSSATYRQQ
jgi:hypothetical protein